MSNPPDDVTGAMMFQAMQAYLDLPPADDEAALEAWRKLTPSERRTLEAVYPTIITEAGIDSVAMDDYIEDVLLNGEAMDGHGRVEG